ncbi:MAG: substrate-binding domain-containing protein [Opitutales bacterium]
MAGERITLGQIAERTGYTVATVSMALRNRPQVNRETRARIQAEARRLGYRPDPEIARLMFRLRAGRNAEAASPMAIVDPGVPPRQQNAHNRRSLEGIRRRAAQMGFQTERFAYEDYGQSPGRLEQVLKARGIEGVLLPALRVTGQPFQFDVTGFSVATSGYTLALPVHRAVANQFNDTLHLLGHLKGRGYRRIGMMLPMDSDLRTNRLYSAAYRVYQGGRPLNQRLEPALVPTVEPATLTAWLDEVNPDALVMQAPGADRVLDWLEASGRQVPDDIGLASLDLPREDTGVAGMLQNVEEMANVMVDLVIAQLQRNERGLPETPRTVLVNGRFLEGQTVRPARETKESSG